MKMRYKNSVIYYSVSCPNAGHYVYYRNNLPDKVYKNQLFGLRFMKLSHIITNFPAGVKIKSES